MLSQTHKDALNKRRPELVDEIDVECLFPYLRRSRLLTLRQEEKIKLNGKTIRSEQVEAILDLVPRQGESAFSTFCTALVDSGQSRIVAEYLQVVSESGSDQQRIIETGPVAKKPRCKCEAATTTTTTTAASSRPPPVEQVAVKDEEEEEEVDEGELNHQYSLIREPFFALTPPVRNTTTSSSVLLAQVTLRSDADRNTDHSINGARSTARHGTPPPAHLRPITTPPRFLTTSSTTPPRHPPTTSMTPSPRRPTTSTNDDDVRVPTSDLDYSDLDLVDFDVYDGGAEEEVEEVVMHSSNDFYIRNSYGAYAMANQWRGYACIINVTSVLGSDEPARVGTQQDCASLTKLWNSFNFEVIIYNDCDDLSAQGIKDKIESFSHLSRQRFAQCAIICVLSHGDNDSIFGTDGVKVSIDYIRRTLDANHCPALAGKPKLIFLEACRGDLSDKIDYDVCDSKAQSDFLIGYPSQQGYKAWRNGRQGSWYVFALVRVFSRLAATCDIHTLMTVVNNCVSRRVTRSREPEDSGNTQMPEVRHSLTKSLYFFPGIYLRPPSSSPRT